MEKFRVALIQLDSQNDKLANLEKTKRFIEEAANNNATLVTLPEYFNFIGTEDEEEANAESIETGETVELLKSLAKKHKIWIHGGSILEKSDTKGKYYNTTVVIDDNGEIHSVYRKIHLYDVEIENGPSFLESNTKLSGDQIVVLDTPFTKVGLTICYDLRFPELFRIQALNGAEIAIVPAEFTLFTGRDHWEVLLRARAIENQLYVIAPGQIGTKPGFQSYGRSMLIDPWGTVTAVASDKEGVIFGEIDLQYLRKLRKEVPSLSNRKPEVYSITGNLGVNANV